MPAPLLAGLAFGGLLAGREGLKSKRKRDEEAKISTALDKLTRPELGVNGYGPPIPGDVGFTSLTPQEVAVVQAMPSEKGLTQAFQFTKDHAAADALAQNQLNFNEDLGVRRDQLKVQQDRLAFDEKKLRIGQAVTAKDLQDTMTRLTDQREGQIWAAGQNADSFNWMNPNTGQIQQIDIEGTPAYNEKLDSIEAERRLLENITELRALNGMFGGREVNPNSPVFAKMESLEKSIQLAMKDVLELGALQGADFELIEGLAPDVNSLLSMMTLSPEALEASYGELSKRISRSLTREVGRVRDWDNVRGEVKQGAANELLKADALKPGPGAPGLAAPGVPQGLSTAVPAIGLLDSLGISPQALLQQGAKASGSVANVFRQLF